LAALVTEPPFHWRTVRHHVQVPFLLNERVVERAQAISAGKGSLMSGPGKIVLVVDEEPGICRLLQIALSDHGFTVHVASTAVTALGMCAKHPVGAILADLDFLGKVGPPRLLASVRQLRPDVRICLMTAGFPHSADELTRLGVARCVCKPMKLEQLIAIMERQFAGREDE
jgi:DNA-binding NtrC family response regulator